MTHVAQEAHSFWTQPVTHLLSSAVHTCDHTWSLSSPGWASLLHSTCALTKVSIHNTDSWAQVQTLHQHTGDPNGHWTSPSHPILPFSEVKFLMLYAVRNTLLRFFTWKVNSYSSSQLRRHFLWEIFTVVICPLFFSLTICPTHPSVPLWAPLGLCTSVLNLMYGFVPPPTISDWVSQRMLFLTLKAGLYLYLVCT